MEPPVAAGKQRYVSQASGARELRKPFALSRFGGRVRRMVSRLVKTPVRIGLVGGWLVAVRFGQVFVDDADTVVGRDTTQEVE